MLPIFHSAADEVSRTNRYCGKFGDEEAFVLLVNGEGITYVEKVQQGLLMERSTSTMKIKTIECLTWEPINTADTVVIRFLINQCI